MNAALGTRAAGMLERLTATERRVAELVTRGHTNNEIADRMHLSVKTVEWNLTKIYRKLGVRSRTELVLKVQGFPRADRAPTSTTSHSSH